LQFFQSWFASYSPEAIINQHPDKAAAVKALSRQYYKNLLKARRWQAISASRFVNHKKYKIFRKKWLTKGRGLSNIAPSNDVPIPQ
jgi:hypothetical protein